MYWYLGEKGNILYVGKAKNLRNRLSSYRLTQDKRIKKMLKACVKVRYVELPSEMDALIIEAELIRLHQPPFNIRSKDDKSPIYIVITKETYPRIYLWRKTQVIQHTSKPATVFGPFSSGREARKLLTFTRHVFPFCSASDTYRRQRKACLWFHLGECPGVCTGTVSLAEYHKTISHIKLFLQGKKKRLLSVLKKDLENAVKKEDFETAAELKKVFTALTFTQREGIELRLPEIETDATQSALKALISILKPYLHLPAQYPLTRIEAYDISHLSGSNPTASMVVLHHGVPDPSAYRHFRIKTVSGINDPHMLEEALRRRLRHAEWPYPNLIVLDGGKSQVSYIVKQQLTSIPLIGIAKNPDRLVVPDTVNRSLITLPLSGEKGGNLIALARNEAHRFTKKYHTRLHLKQYTL